MAACDLVIELDDPKTPRTGGQPVTGQIVVRARGNVKCSALTATTMWSTHGRGNIASGDIDQEVLFEGTWEENQEYRYPFKLDTAAWPPTYHGSYLNVIQMVRAHAKVPWSTDPKAHVEFPVIATASPDDLSPSASKKPKQNSAIAWIIGIIFLVLLAIPLFGLLMIILPIAGLIGGGIWFFTKFLPSRITGKVECTVEPLRIGAGETLRGTLRFTPKKSSEINGIHWTVNAVEKCVSGSGSNRTTHTHEILSNGEILAGKMKLTAGQPHAFDFTYRVPAGAAPSMKFSDNELVWTGKIRIDIPGWPDYSKSFTLVVVPGSEGTTVGAGPGYDPDFDEDEDEDFDEEMSDRGELVGPARSAASTLPSARASSGTTSAGDSDLSFDDVAKQLQSSLGDLDRTMLVVEAVEGLTFRVRADLQGRMFQPPSGIEPTAGTWVLARHRGTELPLGILWPEGRESPRSSEFDWQGSVEVIGYDEQQGRLLMRFTPAP